MKRKKQRKNLMLTRSYARLGWFVLGVGLLACSCAKEPDEIIGTGDDDASLIVPEALVGDVVETETKADLSGVVIGTSFPANYTKVFSVVGYKGTAAPTNWSSPYINNIAVNSGTNGTLSFATPQYYPVDGQKVYFYAYSPVKGATYTAGSGSTAPKVTWTLDGHTDVMAAQVTTGIAKAATGTQSQPSFAFTHKLMQLKFKVMKDAALTDLGNVTALKVNNAATSLSMTLSNGNVTTLSTGSLTAYSSTTGQAVTTTATYLGTNGSPFLTTKTDNLSLTLTCGGKDYTVTPELPADAGPGKTVEITLKLTSGGLIITGIILNSSTSLTIPQAGGTFTLVTRTWTQPVSNISWLVKDADDNEVGQSTSHSNYRTATIQVVDENTEWTDRSLTLFWSYNGSEYKEYTGKYTLNQSGYSFTARCESERGYWGYEGDRNLIIEGSYPSGCKLYIKPDGGTESEFSLVERVTIHLPKNTSGSDITYRLWAQDESGIHYTSSTIVQRNTFPVGETTYAYGSIHAAYKGVGQYAKSISTCTNSGMALVTAETKQILIPIMKAQGMTAIGSYVNGDPSSKIYFWEGLDHVYHDIVGESTEDRSIVCWFDLNK